MVNRHGSERVNTLCLHSYIFFLLDVLSFVQLLCDLQKLVGESSELDQLVANGDPQATTQFIDTVSLVLNEQSSENSGQTAEQQRQEQQARTEVTVFKVSQL